MVYSLSLPGAEMISLSVRVDESVSKQAETHIRFLFKRAAGILGDGAICEEAKGSSQTRWNK